MQVLGTGWFVLAVFGRVRVFVEVQRTTLWSLLGSTNSSTMFLFVLQVPLPTKPERTFFFQSIIYICLAAVGAINQSY